MEQRLYEAAVEGSVTSLRELLREDRLVLDRVVVTYFNETPLHIAAMLGHKDFVDEILRRKLDLATELDSHRSTPLHLASASGHVDTVKALLLAKPEMCAARDRDGRNPLHLAAMKGRVNVLGELLVQDRLINADAARSTVDGDTILHLCVKHNQLEALKLLVQTLNDDEFENREDEHGNTILHLAVSDKQIETIKYLVARARVYVNGINANGFTALDILAKSRRGIKDLDIGDSLRESGALRARDIPVSGNGNRITVPNDVPLVIHDQTTTIPSFGNRNGTTGPQNMTLVVHDQTTPLPTQENNSENNLTERERLAKKKDALMVVASLIATMAFQAGVNPPGGVWQDDSQGSTVPNPHRAGEAVIAYNYPDSYPIFLRANTTGFVASLSVILLLISGLPFKHKFFMWILVLVMWLTITSMALTYAFSIVVVTPKKDREPLSNVIEIAVVVWCGVMTLLLLGHTIRLLEKWLKIDVTKRCQNYMIAVARKICKRCSCKPCQW